MVSITHSLAASQRTGFRPRRVRVARVTTEGFAGLADHARLPARFFGRFTASAEAMLAA